MDSGDISLTSRQMPRHATSRFAEPIPPICLPNILSLQAVYAAQLVGISAMACAKLSVVLLTSRVVVQTPRSLYIALSVVAAWAVFSLISTAFQCQLPTPWEFIPSTCSSHGYVQYPVIATNILTDVALTGWVLPTFWKLNATKEMRVTAMVLFGLRIMFASRLSFE